jgi:hypothetical protein
MGMSEPVVLLYWPRRKSEIWRREVSVYFTCSFCAVENYLLVLGLLDGGLVALVTAAHELLLYEVYTYTSC